jgi:hypothetical protein
MLGDVSARRRLRGVLGGVVDRVGGGLRRLWWLRRVG